MGLGKWFCFASLTLCVMAGCASAEDPGARSLIRQQSATIEGLNNEILRLNQELDGTADLRGGLTSALPKFEKMLAAPVARGDVRIELTRKGLVVAVLDHALFDPDGSQLTSAGGAMLEKIASVLSSDLSGNRIFLEGHTDNQPIENADGVTNWEYSVGRATAILHYFIDIKQLSPERFGIAGYAEYRPVASNDTEEGRDKNRRVEIVITPERSSDALER